MADDRVALDERPVLVLDFGAQYAQLIARRVRECRVRSELVPYDISPEEVLERQPYGLILSGGPASISEPGAPALDPRLLQLGIPVKLEEQRGKVPVVIRLHRRGDVGRGGVRGGWQRQHGERQEDPGGRTAA